MKMKRILCLAFAALMLLTLLSGCADKKEDGSSSKSDSSASGGVIKIGWLGPLTGNVAQYGQAVKSGVDLYIEKLNAAGGINGKKVELFAYDEEGDTTKAVTGYNACMDEGVVAIVGSVTTAPTVAVVTESYADNTPMITASATAIDVTYNASTDTVYKNMFRSCFIDSFQGVTMARFAKEELKASTAAVLYNKDDTYSTGVYEYFVNECGNQGIDVLATESYSDGAVDFSGQLTNIAAQKPDVLFLPVYYSDVALIATQAADAGITATMLGVDGWSTVLNTISDPSYVNGAYYCSGYSEDDTRELVVNFLADYAAKYDGAVSNMFGAQGYDAAWILCDAIAAAEKSGKDYGSDEYKQAIIDAMSKTDKEFVTGHVSFDSHNDPQKTAAIISINDGKESFWGSF